MVISFQMSSRYPFIGSINLSHPHPFFLAGQDVFGNFLKSEFSEENIEFWLACEDYKKTESDLLHRKAEQIYKAFVQSDAAKQVSVKVLTTGSYVKGLSCRVAFNSKMRSLLSTIISLLSTHVAVSYRSVQ